MEFLEKIIEEVDPAAQSSAITPFSYLIKCEHIKIHYVRIEHFNKSTYTTALKLLHANHPFFITVFEDQFKREPKKVLDRLKYHSGKSLRIHGRDTKAQKITKPVAHQFLEENHGNVALKAKINYGLFDKENKLVAVACFGQIINMRTGAKSSELIRFCNQSGSRVVGGLTKLINHFHKTHAVDELMTYCDLEWSDGSNFRKLEFKEIDTLAPTQFVISLTNWERTHAAKFQKENDISSLNFDEFRTVENLGSLKFIKYFNV